MKLTKNQQYSNFAKSTDVLIEAVFTDENSEFIVEKHRILDNPPFEYRLTIKRGDKKPIHSWSLLQEIKDQVAGENVVAIEIYPEKSKVTDTANMYHLWVFAEGYGPKVSLIPVAG
ncbi:DUF7694 domain-containing protein [Saccharophagus degradans]|uniref:DUF7694 domain-containing protein n=1 Tax=Saccharophagus degradans TaxID=86304 RepID=A0AAW7X755_9GAMM|nr:hypothetical protein [Saccharophagus degradans]MDO6423516.1 hypothetical protein [Saccharophagus degradans]MDO6606921.1 hypothetical protein [Saccharophagus degradans]